MFNTLFAFIDTAIVANISSMVGVFTSTITPLLGACVILYVIYLSYQALFDAQNMMIIETIKLIGSLAAVTFIAFNTVWYLANIVPAVLGSGDQIAKALLGGKGSTGTLQAIFESFLLSIDAMIDKIEFDFLDGDTWISTGLIFLQIAITILGFLPFLGVAVAYLVVAKIMVSFLLIIGPLFIMFAFFPSTRSFFQAWTGQCFNYTLLTIMYPIAFTLFDQVLDNTINVLPLSLGTSLLTFIVFGALILLSVQIPTFCSTLSGGIGISGLVGGTIAGIGALGRGAKGVGKGGMAGAKGAVNMGGKIGSAVKNIGKGGIKAG